MKMTARCLICEVRSLRPALEIGDFLGRERGALLDCCEPFKNDVEGLCDPHAGTKVRHGPALPCDGSCGAPSDFVRVSVSRHASVTSGIGLSRANFCAAALAAYLDDRQDDPDALADAIDAGDRDREGNFIPWPRYRSA